MRLIGWLFIGAAAIFLGRGYSYAAPRANVELVYFEAILLDSGVKLQWSTATELATAGFKIRRGQHGAYADLAALVDSQGKPITDGFIPALGNPTIGSDYEVIDPTAAGGETYTYVLVEVEADFTEVAIGTATTVAAITPSATPIVAGGAASATPGHIPPLVPTATAMPTVAAPSASTETATAGQSTPHSTPELAVIVTPETAAGSAAVIDGNSSSRRADTATRPAVAGASGQVLALVQDEPTAVNGYPGSTGTPPEVTEAYPAVQPSPLPADTFTPYPAVPAGAESSPPPVSIIGDETEAGTSLETAANDQQVSALQARRGRIFLWGGFIVALLLFVTGVAGSIVLFMRRRG